MPSGLRVCLVINSLSHGGAEHLLVDLVEAIDRTEVAFTIVHMGEDALTEPLREAGATVQRINEQFRFEPSVLSQLSYFLHKNSFNLVHLHLPYSQTIGRIAATLAGGIPVVSTQHNVPANYHPVTRTTERITRPLDAATVAVSQGVERSFTGGAHKPNEPNLDDQWCTIYNGIDVRSFRDQVSASPTAELKEKYGINDEQTVFLNVGRYVEVKSQRDLIKGFEQMGESDAHLFIVGHGPLEKDLRAAGREASGQIHVTGEVSRVYPYYAVADAFASTSRAEGMPVTLLEAMAAELPVIATDIAGTREVVVDGKTGHLYPYGDIKQLRELLRFFTSLDSQSRYGSAGLDRAHNVFDVKHMAEAYLKLYQTTVAVTKQ